MKFRAKMYDPPTIRQFYDALSSVPKASKHSILRLSQDNFYFIYMDPCVNSGIMWCQMRVNAVFTDYILEGVTNEDPEIYLEIPHVLMSQSLCQAMKSAVSTVKCVKVKLTRKHEQACLSFYIEMAGNRQCIHDIPVTPVPRKDWSDFEEPKILPTEEIVRMQVDVKQLKHFADRYKHLGPYATFIAPQSGSLEMVLKSEKAELCTKFKFYKALENLSALEDKENGVVEVKCELKKLSAFLSSDHVGAKRCVASFVNKKILHLCLVKDELCLQYYFPAYGQL